MTAPTETTSTQLLVQPNAALAMVGFSLSLEGLSLEDVATALDLEDGLQIPKGNARIGLRN